MLDVFWGSYYLALAVVILGHFGFAYLQWFKWPGLAKSLTKLPEGALETSASLGRSFASYNASIAVGLLLSFRLEDPTRMSAQAVVLALIVATAAVGAAGTKTNRILKFRLTPAAAALVFYALIQAST